MNDQTERLLTDILAEEAPAGFRAALLDDTLRLARRRRHYRQAHRVVTGLALVLGLFFISWHWFVPASRSPESSKPYVVFRTQPLPPQALIRTQSLPPAGLVASTLATNVMTTADAGYHTRELDDEELLALAAPKPVILVRYSPHQAELVFATSPSN
jgi:hypothetical protein